MTYVSCFYHAFAGAEQVRRAQGANLGSIPTFGGPRPTMGRAATVPRLVLGELRSRGPWPGSSPSPILKDVLPSSFLPFSQAQVS